MVGGSLQRWLGCFAGLSIIVAVSSCGGSPPAAELPTPIPNIPTAIASPASSAAALTFTNQNWGAVAQDPEKYTGASVHLTGQVFNLEQDQSRVGMQVWTDPLRGEGNTVVMYPKAGFPVVSKGDQVEIEGKVIGVFAGQNDAGSPLKLPKIEATSVLVLNPASLSPAPSSLVDAAVAGGTAIASPTPTPAETATPEPISPGRFRVAGAGTGGLSVRNAPGIGARKLGVVHDGEAVQVVAQAVPGWAQVRGANFSGYVARQYLAGPVAASNQALGKLEAK